MHACIIYATIVALFVCNLDGGAAVQKSITSPIHVTCDLCVHQASCVIHQAIQVTRLCSLALVLNMLLGWGNQTDPNKTLH